MIEYLLVDDDGDFLYEDDYFGSVVAGASTDGFI